MRYIATKELHKMNYEELREAGFLDYIKVRNNTIREKHDQNLAKGMATKDSIEQLAEEYFISETAIISVIYSRRKK